MPKTWDDLFTAGKAFRAKVGDKGYLLDGNLYDLILVSHAYAYQSTARRGSTPRTGKVAMSAAALKDWVAFTSACRTRTSRRRYRIARVSAASKSRRAAADWVAGNWGGVYTWDSTVRVFGSTLPGKNRSSGR